jgi:hypothetical protein
MKNGGPRLPLVVRELVARRATGVLAVRTLDASGEIRLRHGSIEDVVLGRAEGKKALARMLQAAELTLAFRDADGGWLRRIDAPADALMENAARACDAAVRARAPFADRDEAFAVVGDLTESRREALSPLARALASRVRYPLGLAEVLDLSAEDDADVLRALAELDAAGALRWMWPQSERQPLASALWDRSGVAERLGAGARVVFAGTPDRLAVFAHSLLYVDDVTRPASSGPLVPMPHVIATSTIDRVNVDVVVCPLVPVYSPLWPLSLSCAALVVRLDEAAPGLLEAAAELAGARVIAAEALVGPLDEASVGAVVAVLRAALDEAALA